MFIVICPHCGCCDVDSVDDMPLDLPMEKLVSKKWLCNNCKKEFSGNICVLDDEY